MASSERGGIAAGDCHAGRYSTQLYAERLAHVIESHANNNSASDGAATTSGSGSSSSSSAAAPLFLYAAFQAIHAPLNTPPPDAWTPEDESLFDALDQDCTSGHRRTVARIARTLDRAIERVIGALEAHGMLDGTVVAFAPDNGACPADGGSNWPMRGTKFSNYEGGVRVPAFVWSAKLPLTLRGTTYHGLMHAADWLPTFATLAGRADLTPRGVDGVDQWRAMRAAADDDDSAARPGPRDEVLLITMPSCHHYAAHMSHDFEFVPHSSVRMSVSSSSIPLRESNCRSHDQRCCST